MSARLGVAGLAVERGGLAVLEGVSFGVPARQALILRGPNGVGKTTLLRVLAGLQKPLAGRVEAAPDDIAYASHADGIKATLSVAENLQFWAGIHGTGVPDGVYDLFDLADLRGREAGTLSSGQKRRLGLARLAVIDRPIWLLDEPTISLDRQSVARFAEFLTQHHLARGGIAVIATHIDLGIEAETLDLTAFRARRAGADGSDGAFL